MPLNHVERAAQRRFAVKELLLQGCSYRQIMEKLSLDFSTVNRDTHAIYKLHGVKGHGHHARRALAAKLGVPLVTKGDQIRKNVADLREKGFTWKQTAHQLGLRHNSIPFYRDRAKIAAQKPPEKPAQLEPSPAPAAATSECLQ
jgi:hypothetical protein